MAGKSAILENGLLLSIFNANIRSELAGIFANPSTGALTNLYVALHTADPTDAGSQTSNECTYTGYARVAVLRTVGGFVVTGSSVSPAANVDFPACTAGSNVATHFSIGTASSGAGAPLYSGTITPNIAIVTGTIPRITPASTVTES